MDRTEVKAGKTYRSKGGGRYRVEAMNGNKLVVTKLGFSGTPEFDTTLSRFASRMECEVTN